MNSTARKSSRRESQTVIWTPPLSSEISGDSSQKATPNSIKAVSMWLAAVSPVSRSLSPENSREKTTPEICGLQPFAVYKSSDPNMSFSKMSPDSFPHDPIAAYAAGLIDGEGHIGIQASKKKSTNYYYVEVTIGMSEKGKELLKAMMGEFGGTIIKGRTATEKWAASLKWRIGGEGAIAFLERIRPFAVLKKHQVVLALKWGELANSLESLPNGTRKWTPDARMKAERMKEQMHLLNQKGPGAPDAGAGWYNPMPTLFGTWEPFSETWPKQGMMQDGLCWALTIAELHTEESGCGSGVWIGTPRATEAIMSDRFRKGRTPSPEEYVRMWPTPRSGKTTDENEETWLSRKQDGKVSTPPLNLAVKMWPTPATRDYRSESCSPEFIEEREAETRGKPLSWRVLWPTPTKPAPHDTENTVGKLRKPREGYGLELANAVHGGSPTRRTYPTPSCMDTIDRKGMSPSREATNRKTGYLSEMVPALKPKTIYSQESTNEDQREHPGQLNPDWVEWLMGWPIGWTDLKPLEMDRFQSWLQQHGAFSQEYLK